MKDTSVLYEVMKDQSYSLIAVIVNNSESHGGSFTAEEVKNMIVEVRKQSRSVPTRDVEKIKAMTDVFIQKRHDMNSC